MTDHRKPVPLTHHQTIHALYLFRQGKDTLDIARALNVPEASVYNSLRDVRDMRRAS